MSTPIQMQYNVYRLIVEHGEGYRWRSEYVIFDTLGWGQSNQNAKAYVEEKFVDALWRLETSALSTMRTF